MGHPDDARLRVHYSHGETETLPIPVRRWHGALPPEERELLSLAREPVLDVGCGPGRHVAALHAHGLSAYGIDVSEAAVESARQRGARADRISVFSDVPNEGRWQTVLLLDGNIGIGGNPTALLARVRELLGVAGRALIELEGPQVVTTLVAARVELADGAGPLFPWARIGINDVESLAKRAQLSVISTWERAGRWFAHLERL